MKTLIERAVVSGSGGQIREFNSELMSKIAESRGLEVLYKQAMDLGYLSVTDYNHVNIDELGMINKYSIDVLLLTKNADKVDSRVLTELVDKFNIEYRHKYPPFTIENLTSSEGDELFLYTLHFKGKDKALLDKLAVLINSDLHARRKKVKVGRTKFTLPMIASPGIYVPESSSADYEHHLYILAHSSHLLHLINGVKDHFKDSKLPSRFTLEYYDESYTNTAFYNALAIMDSRFRIKSIPGVSGRQVEGRVTWADQSIEIVDADYTKVHPDERHIIELPPRKQLQLPPDQGDRNYLVPVNLDKKNK